MTYSLGVDLGTTSVAAAVARSTGVEMFMLGERDVVTPAVVHVSADGSISTGDSAERRAARNPELVGRGVKRRLGDSTPIMLSNVPYFATTLLGAQLRDVVAKVVDAEGGPPERIVLTHPAGWEPRRRELFAGIASAAGLESAQLVTESDAIAVHAAGRLNEGEIAAVYDLGGGAFTATVVRKLADGHEILGTPERIDGLGGVAFDEAILAHVDDALDGALTGLDPGDAQSSIALARLRQDCILAKEALSLDRETVIPVFLPGRHGSVQLTRAIFEEMVRAHLESTIDALSRAVRSAGQSASDLTSVLLVGGSSRIPLVAEMVSRELGRPTVADADPEYAMALGAASIAATSTAAAPIAEASVAEPPVAAEPTVEVSTVATAEVLVAEVSVAAGSTPALPAPRPPAADLVLAGAPERPVVPLSAIGSGPLPTGEETVAEPTELRPVRRLGPARLATAVQGSRPRIRLDQLPLAAAVAVAALILALVFVLAPGTPGGGPAAPAAPPSPAPAAPAAAPPAPAPPAAPPITSVAQPTVAGTFGVATGPRAGTVSPDGALAYVAGSGTRTVSVVDLATNAVVADIPIEAGPPFNIALTPDGSRAYVTVYDAAGRTGDSVVVLDTQTRAVTATIPTESYPYGVAVAPDGRRAYVTNHDANLVSVIDTASNAVINKIGVKPNPHGIAFSRDGARVYVANHDSNLVTVLDTANGAVVAEIPVGRSPHSLATSPDGSRVYVVNYDADSVAVIDPAANTVVGTVPVQRKPQSVEFAPDGKHAYVVNDGSDTVSVIDTATGQATATIGVGQAPTQVFLAPDGGRAYVTNIRSNDVTVLDIAA
jgi:YVTN family beta-propeller protein